jgi:hypothetical protein
VSEDLTAWLRKQIESDLALARRVASRYVFPLDNGTPRAGQPFWPTPGAESAFRRWGDPDILAGLDLVKAFGPQWVTGDCEAKLAVLDAYESAVKRREQEQADYGAWVRGEAPAERPQFNGPDPALIPGLEMAVRLLGSGYRHRPGYREEWKP